ncbi:MAG: hypothetical protein R3F53_22430 [Gammaproteobacteria bacterium]
MAPDYNPSSIHADLWISMPPGAGPFFNMSLVQVILEENSTRKPSSGQNRSAAAGADDNQSYCVRVIFKLTAKRIFLSVGQPANPARL